MYVGLEMGTPSVLADQVFFDHLLSSYLWSLFIILPVSYMFIKYAVKITNVPFQYYFWLILASLVWSSTQYTGMLEDYLMLAACAIVGLLLKYLKFSRISFLIGFILSARVESSYMQFTGLYEWHELLTNTVPLLLLIATGIAMVYGVFFNKAKIDFV
jgi:TctA family transporter